MQPDTIKGSGDETGKLGAGMRWTIALTAAVTMQLAASRFAPRRRSTLEQGE